MTLTLTSVTIQGHFSVKTMAAFALNVQAIPTSSCASSVLPRSLASRSRSQMLSHLPSNGIYSSAWVRRFDLYQFHQETLCLDQRLKQFVARTLRLIRLWRRSAGSLSMRPGKRFAVHILFSFCEKKEDVNRSKDSKPNQCACFCPYEFYWKDNVLTLLWFLKDVEMLIHAIGISKKGRKEKSTNRNKYIPINAIYFDHVSSFSTLNGWTSESQSSLGQKKWSFAPMKPYRLQPSCATRDWSALTTIARALVFSGDTSRSFDLAISEIAAQLQLPIFF